nr:hypothetical protein L203_03405 [Cryptococcus depauperatus CBS 7841]
MSQMWPSTSTQTLLVDSKNYDVLQLSDAVDTAIGRGGVETQGSPLGSSCFHLHTSTLQASVQPPDRIIDYHGRESERNPAYDVFNLLRKKLQKCVDPFIPLQLQAPAADILRRSLGNKKHSGDDDGLSIFIPSISSRREPLMTLEPIYCPKQREWTRGSTAWDTRHWINTILALDPTQEPTRKGVYRDKKKRVCLQTDVKICWIQDDNWESKCCIEMLVGLHVYLDMSVLFDPSPDIGRDMLGCILHSLMPSPNVSSVTTPELQSAALKDFYDCLKPAPKIPFDFPIHRLQPKELASKLLPFQMRTLKLLLEREGAPGYERNESASKEDPEGFWSKYDLGTSHGVLAYRRVTGDLCRLVSHRISNGTNSKGKNREVLEEEGGSSLTESEKEKLPLLLDLTRVRGTMLCEEMGLGKTVEAIALIVSNRHPVSFPRTLPQPLDMTWPENPHDIEKAPIPTIDLFHNFPGFNDPNTWKWIEKEQAVFHDRKSWDEEAKLYVSEVAATLIVTPPSLLQQWVSEISRHAPSLRICVYEGWKSLQRGIQRQQTKQLQLLKKHKVQKQAQSTRKYVRRNNDDRHPSEPGREEDMYHETRESESLLDLTQRQFVNYVRAHDVVVTTYSDLSQDLKFAFPAPTRSRRSNVDYKENERFRSPLVMIEWWRVIMDEVQLHGDQTSAAEMVSLIPRKNSLAVSGTPAKSNIKDLMGSLRFLRVPVLPHDHRLWYRLQQPSMRSAFQGIFQTLATRTTKKEVNHEFTLPHQSRIVVPIELSDVEMHYYNDTLQRFRERLRLPENPRDTHSPNWVLDRQLFQMTLRILRQVCTHVQVGQLHGHGRDDQRLRLGRHLMTMAEALDKMKEDHLQETLIEARQQMRAIIHEAQLKIMDDKDETRHLQALTLYERSRTAAEKHLIIIKQRLEQLLGGREDTEGHLDEMSTKQSQQEKVRSHEIVSTKQSIRELSIIIHQSWFFEGDVRHVQKDNDKEVYAYAQADNIRNEILAKPLLNANMSIVQLRKSLERHPIVNQLQELQIDAIGGNGGILSSHLVSQVAGLLKIMNDTAYLIFHWRKEIIDLLSSPIDASGDIPESTNQEVESPEADYYAKALQAQGKVEAYFVAYTAALADRREFMFETRSSLAEHDARIVKQRYTQAAANAGVNLDITNMPNDVAEEAASLMAERQAFRDARVKAGCERPLKALLMDFNGIAYGPHRIEEVQIAKYMATELKRYIVQQNEYLEKLDKELDVFRTIFNRRVTYFAALQEISDSVSAPEFKDLQKEIEATQKEVYDLEKKLGRMAVKGRYLHFLGTKEHDQSDIKENCIICFGSSDDTEAVLLQCGHHFCLSCYKEYRKSRGGQKCPSCRVEISNRELQRVRINAKLANSQNDKAHNDRNKTAEAIGDLVKREELHEDPICTRRSSELASLRMMEIDCMREIMQLDMMGEFGSKINVLIKHLLYYKSKEPDARHLIFSNWHDSLTIVMRALQANNLSFISFDQNKKHKDVVDQFIKDESITVFLLHAERESSGLTLTSCRVVHLLEPVLSHSFELQAIGRVDRLGQQKETSVYCYATMDTVESRILSQGVRNGSSIYLADKHADNVVAEMPNLASAAHRGGDILNGEEENLLDLMW